MYNFFSYFMSVVILVFGVLIGWFAYQFIQEKKILSEDKDS